MKRIMLRKPFDIDIKNAAAPVPDREQILVRTRAIGIAAGTEMALYLGTYHDLVLRRWKPQWEYPMYTGYEAVDKELDVLASSQAGPAGAPPPGQLRWTGLWNKRLVIDYLAEGRLRTNGLVSHVLGFAETRRASEMIDKKPEPSMQVVLRWHG